jgi:hypothetical protein
MLRPILACGAVALVAATAAAAAAPLQGTFQTVIANAPVKQLDGTWRLTLQPGGGYTTKRNGVVLVRGHETQTATTITFVDQSGPMACSAAQATGTYRWSRSGSLLRLTPVRESCTGRRLVLTAHPLHKLG